VALSEKLSHKPERSAHTNKLCHCLRLFRSIFTP